MKILWTKKYNLNHEMGAFNIYISLHSSGLFYGGIIYYSKTGSFSVIQSIEVKLEMKQFVNDDESKVYHQCIDWVNKNLEGKYTVSLIDEEFYDNDLVNSL